MKIELGGGTRQRGEGWVNLDIVPGPAVDHVVDFSKLVTAGLDGPRLPFPDFSVDEVYSSHCLEHVDPYNGLLHEVVRVCRIGARVEIRVPHWLSSMAMAGGHRHTVSPKVVIGWCVEFAAEWWTGCARRLSLVRTEYIPSAVFPEARKLFPHMTDEQVMRFVPDACHEIRYFFEVIKN